MNYDTILIVTMICCDILCLTITFCNLSIIYNLYIMYDNIRLSQLDLCRNSSKKSDNKHIKALTLQVPSHEPKHLE